MRELMRASSKNTGMVLTLALSYGGREEIARAARAVAQQVAAGTLKADEIDEGTLGSVGREGYVMVDDSSALAAAFQQIGERIVAMTQRFYLLSYCSPARAGEHVVTVEATTETGSGSLSYEFDAEGFGPDCDPNPLISVTIMPRTPASVSASRTSSSLNGLIVAMMSFTDFPFRISGREPRLWHRKLRLGTALAER